MKYDVIWPEAALAQVREIYDYVADLAGEVAANKLAIELLDSTKFLTDNPRLYPIFPGSLERARHIVVRPAWRLLYTVNDATRSCCVVAVVPTSRSS
jgi:plasmid stabilization system protein ParE